MLTTNTGTVKLPPADPDRLSVLATLIFRGLLSPDDKLTILTFQSGAVGRYRELPPTQASIRDLRFDQSTPFTGPLKRAREILSQSRLSSRRLLLFTDGSPSQDDPLSGTQARALLGFEPLPAGTLFADAAAVAKQPFEVLSLGLSANVPELKQAQQQFLAALGPVEAINTPRDHHWLYECTYCAFAVATAHRPARSRWGVQFSGRKIRDRSADQHGERPKNARIFGPASRRWTPDERERGVRRQRL